MPTPYKLTTRKESDFRRQRAAFKKLKTDQQKFEFLVNCEWWPMEFFMSGVKGLNWYPTAVGIIMIDPEHQTGFATPEEAVANGLKLQAEYKQVLAGPAPQST